MKSHLVHSLTNAFIADHFAEVGKMVDLGPGNRREVDDIMLTRYA